MGLALKQLEDLASAPRPLWLPIFGRREFERAVVEIEGLDCCLTYDDYVEEIDGLRIGLSSAGVVAELVPLGLAGFRSWRMNFGVRSSLAMLEKFAACVATYRGNREWPVHAKLAERPMPYDTVAVDRFSRHVVLINRTRYLTWAACFAGALSSRLESQYASLLVEHWIEA